LRLIAGLVPACFWPGCGWVAHAGVVAKQYARLGTASPRRHHRTCTEAARGEPRLPVVAARGWLGLPLMRAAQPLVEQTGRATFPRPLQASGVDAGCPRTYPPIDDILVNAV